MNWATSLVIGGAILATGPVILHIIFRRRFMILDWAAMRFLLESLRRNKQRLRIEELIVIALRVLACLLIGLTLANPRGASFVPGGRAPTAHIYILDDSCSMGQQIGSDTLFQKAVAYLTAQLRELPDTDSVAILSAAQPVDGHLVKHLAPATELRREDFSRRLAALKPKDGPARLPEVLAAAKSLAESQTGLSPRIYLLSDFRLREFGGGTGSDTLRVAFGAAAAVPAELVLLDFGEPCRTNLTVEKVVQLDRVLAANIQAQFQATVRNNGGEPVENAALMVQLGSVTLPAVILPALGPGETITKAFSCTFPEAGPAALKVTLTPDALPADSTASLALEVREALNVLIVDGAVNPQDPLVSSSFWLYYALDPEAKGNRGQRITQARLEELTPALLARNDTVVLTNVKEFDALAGAGGKSSYPQLEMLAEYVRSGGGLVVFLGDRADPAFYNGPFYADGSGLNPFRLKGDLPTVDRKKYHRLRPDSIAPDPMLRIFTGRGEQFTRLVRFYAFMPADQREPASLAQGVGPAEVLARFDDPEASPAAARRGFGKGQVLFWYTAPDTRWTDWPKDLSFLPVMNDMVWLFARPSSGELDGMVGQPVSLELADELADAARITMKTPAYPTDDLQPLMARGEGRKKMVSFAGTRFAGLYELEVTLPDQSRRTVFFSRRLDPTEGNLAKADQSQIAAMAGQPHIYEGNMSTRAPQTTAAADIRSYWWWFLITVLVFLIMELFLAQRFGHFGGPAVETRGTP